MGLLIRQNIKSAFSSIWQNKVQSTLAILGVVIGVSAVTILVGLGQGLKNDVAGMIQGFGTNVLFVLSGKLDVNSKNTNPANFIAGDILTSADVDAIRVLPNVQEETPISLVSGAIKYNGKVTNPTLFGTDANAISIIGVLSLKDGSMFASRSAGNQIVLSRNATQELFGETSPIGQKVSISDREFTVVGTLNKTKGSSLFGSEFDAVSFIPFDTATAINKGIVKINRIGVKAKDSSNVNDVKQAIHNALLKTHNNDENFSVFTQDDLLGLFNTFLNLATTLVSAIAAISLIVGGIGIMNIMLVTVTERTREIGLRKAVGATSRAILIQFLTESLVVTLFGGLIGLLVSFAAVHIVELRTSLHPQITTSVILMALGISTAIGILFGLWPALRAALKDPIEALRYE